MPEKETDAHISRHEFDMMAGMVQDHNKRIRDIEKFVELAPDSTDHHDDHLYVGQSRERMNILIHSFMENAGKFLFLLVLLGVAALVADKAGFF